MKPFTYNSPMAENIAKQIDRCALSAFNIPSWILKRQWLVKLYAKFYKLKVEKQQRIDLTTEYRFFKCNKKVGEIRIKE